MRTPEFLSEGARQVLRFKKLVALFYAANLAAALVLALPVAVALRDQLGHSMESGRLFANIDAGWVSEMLYQHGALPGAAFGATAAVVAVLFLVLNTFLSGGAIAVFAREEDTFFGACARFFPRLLRLLLIGLVCYGLVLAVNNGIVAATGRLRENSMEARPWVIVGWARLLLILFLFGTVNMVFDYAKIACVVDNRRSALKSVWAAFGFVWANLRSALAIYWMCSLIGFSFLLAYHGFSELIGQGSAAGVVLLFFVRQAYVLGRMWTRLWTWSAETGFYIVSAQTFSSTIVAPEPPSPAAAG